jgi:RNA polymerase sigma-70 factor (ECF subfamily)
MVIELDSFNEDRQIMQRITDRDNESLRELYSLYGRKMYAYAFSLLQDPDLADEVVQDCLVVAWQKASDYRGQGRLIAWLLGIIHHKSISLLRRSSPIPLDEIPDDPASPDLTPPQEAESREKTQLIQQVLQKLSPDHQMVIQLVFFQHLTLSETSKVIRCPVGTVKSRLAYAKQMLKGALTRAGFQPEDA